MALSINTTDNLKAQMEGGEGWQGGLGMIDTIKKEEHGMFTTPRTKVSETQDFMRQAQERTDMLGDEYGSPILKDIARRGVDLMRDVDYVGNQRGRKNTTVGTAEGVGLPLGKPKNLISYETEGWKEGIDKQNIHGFLKDGLLSKAHNVGEGTPNINLSRIKNEKFVKGDTSKMINDNVLKINVVPTKTFKSDKTNTSHETYKLFDTSKSVTHSKVIPKGDGKSLINTQKTIYKDNYVPFVRSKQLHKNQGATYKKPLYNKGVFVQSPSLQQRGPNVEKYIQKTFDKKYSENKPVISAREEKLNAHKIVNKNIRREYKPYIGSVDKNIKIKEKSSVSVPSGNLNIKRGFVDRDYSVGELKPKMKVGNFMSSGTNTFRKI